MELLQFQGFYSGRDDWIRTSGLCVPNATLYQAEPHPGVCNQICVSIADLYIVALIADFFKNFIRENENIFVLAAAVPLAAWCGSKVPLPRTLAAVPPWQSRTILRQAQRQYRTPQHFAHRSTSHTDLPRGAVLSAEIRHHKLNEAPRELQAIEDDDTAADNIDDAQSLICEFGAEQGNNCRDT